MINLKLWRESLDSEVSFQWRRALLEVNVDSKTFPEDIFVVSEKLYIKLTLTLVLLWPVYFKKMKVVQAKPLQLRKGFRNQNDHQSSWVITFTWNVFHVDVAFFLMQHVFVVVVFKIWMICVKKNLDCSNALNLDPFAKFVLRFLQNVIYFLRDWEKITMNQFEICYVQKWLTGLEILDRVADRFGLLQSKEA